MRVTDTLTQPQKAAVELLLIEWANLPTIESAAGVQGIADHLLQRSERTALAKFVKRFPTIFPRGSEDNFILVLWPQQLLRRAWAAASERDYRTSDWFVYKLRETYDFIARGARSDSLKELVSGQSGPPPLTEFERAMYYFHSIAHRARRCANKNCCAPYFLSVAKAQAYCGPQCSSDAVEDGKKEWWKKNRDRINADRRRKYQQSHKSVRKGKNGTRKRRPV